MSTILLIGILVSGSTNQKTEIGTYFETREDRADLQVLAKEESDRLAKFRDPRYSDELKREILSRFSYVDPDRIVPRDLLEPALLFYHQNIDNIANSNYLSVLNFSAHSSQSRFYIVEMKSGLVRALHVAHGTNSDKDNDGYADEFSNIEGSLMSSLGFYYASEEYVGRFGRSIRMDGLSETNSNARIRAIVIHGALYVQERNEKQGRTWGCFGFAIEKIDEVVDRLRGGSLIYAGLSAIR